MHAKRIGKRRQSLIGILKARLRISFTQLQHHSVGVILIVAVVLVWFYIVSLMFAEGVL